MGTVSLAKGKTALQQLNEWMAELEAALPKPVETPTEPDEIDEGLQNPSAFYDYIRGDVGELFPKMSQSQFDGVQQTLRSAAGVLPLTWCAYVLATEYHETGARMQACREAPNSSEDWRKRNLRYYPWYGRGEVQLTWERNYRYASERLTALLGRPVDLVADKDLALDPVISTAVMIYGMIEGWFTGKKLNSYINNNGGREQYVNARRIINGTDKAELIAGYAVEFEKALKLGDWR